MLRQTSMAKLNAYLAAETLLLFPAGCTRLSNQVVHLRTIRWTISRLLLRIVRLHSRPDHLVAVLHAVVTIARHHVPKQPRAEVFNPRLDEHRLESPIAHPLPIILKTTRTLAEGQRLPSALLQARLQPEHTHVLTISSTPTTTDTKRLVVRAIPTCAG